MNNTAEVIEAAGSQIVEFNEFESKLAEYKDRYEGVIYDMAVPEQGKQAKSDRLAIGKVISKLDATHKQVKAPLKARVDLLDGERKRIKDQLLEIQDSIKSQISEHEAKIQAEKDELIRRAGALRALREFEFPPTIEQVEDRIATINATEIDDSYGEMKAYAALNKMESLQILEPMLAGLKAKAEQEAEAERARIEAQRKAQEEREKQIAEEAAAKAKAEAAEAVERERLAKIKAEQDAKLAAEKAERDRKAAELRAKQDAIEAAERAEREKQEAVARAEREANERAEQAERARLAAIEHDRIAAEKREANKRHCGKINKAAAVAICNEAGITEDQAKAVITAIAKGLVPAVSISY